MRSTARRRWIAVPRPSALNVESLERRTLLSVAAAGINAAGLGAAPHVDPFQLNQNSTVSFSSNSTALVDLAPAPTLVTAAAADPNPVTSTTTTLSALAAENGTDNNLTYTWSATGPADVSYSDNATNSAKSTTATFTKTGDYIFTVTIADPAGASTTSTVNISVDQTLTNFAVSPNTAAVADGATKQFLTLASDQFNNPMTVLFAWSLDPGSAGSLSISGLYTAPAAGPGSATVRANAAGGLTASASITITFTTINGTSGNDIITLTRASGSLLQVFAGNPSTLQYSVPLASLGALSLNALDGDDTILLEFAGPGGSPIPAAGLTIDGGSGTDSIIIVGTANNDSATAAASSITFNNSTINYLNTESITLASGMGTDTLTQSAQPSAALAFDPLSNSIVNINAGTYTVPPSAGGLQPITFGTLNIAAAATFALAGPTDPLNHDVLILASLSNAGILDLGANDMILQNGGATGLSQITTQLAAGFNAAHGYWNGSTGITSSAASHDTTVLSALGVMQNTNGNPFQGISSNIGDILIKHTYYGDADLNGSLNGADYQQIDNGFGNHLTAWANGDFNYDNLINGSDFALLDNAFNQLTATSAAPQAIIIRTTKITPIPIARSMAIALKTTIPAMFNQSTPLFTPQSPDDILEASAHRPKHLQFQNP